MSHSSLVEKQKLLVQTVARAFYTDDVVILLDALVREKFIKSEEIGPRLHISKNDVTRILLQLETKEGLIKCEYLTIDGFSFKCYYIDYQSFTNIVRYRVKLMQEGLKKQELKLTQSMFQCPTCNEVIFKFFL